MKITIIKILTPLILCLYADAFLELDFGTHTQTWGDENDSYVIDSKTISFDFTDFSSVPLLSAVIPATISIHFSAEEPVIGNFTNDFSPGLHDHKIFIKNRVFLI